MKIKNDSPIVNVYFEPGTNKTLMGRLARKNHKIFFEYDPDFIKTGIELSPFKLPLQLGAISSEDFIFEGLFGVFNDSLPDGWGRLLLDRSLVKSGINPHDISPLERLCYVGNNGMGALSYEPEYTSNTQTIYNNVEQLDEIANHIIQFQEHDEETFIEELLLLNGSSAGARPKYLVNLLNAKSASNKHNDWIIKFRSSIDPKDIGAIEYAYHLIALKAKIDVPEARLFLSKNNTGGYFGVKRFDRIDNNKLHMHSISGLLHVDHRIPSLDYETIMKATFWLTKNISECEKLFRLATFNVYMHNRDDHAKNFSYLLNLDNTWRISPAYDLTFSSGPSGEHCTTVMGEGKSPNKQHLLQLAEIGNINKQRAGEIIDEIQSAASMWSEIAKNTGVTKNSITMINKHLQKA